MIYTNEHKLALSGWLKENNAKAYASSLKLQKFLFFYEAATKSDGGVPDFDHLRGYVNGPVYSNVWGDYTKEWFAFTGAAETSLRLHEKTIDISKARFASFLVSILEESELSDLTHAFHIWNVKEDRIMGGGYQVSLDESDFDSGDIHLTKTLLAMYPEEMINHSYVLPVKGKNFVFSTDDARLLTEQQADTLWRVADDPELINPVFVQIDAEGRLIID